MKEKSIFIWKAMITITFSLVILLACGCASLLDGPEQSIRIHCEPSQNVEVLANGKSVVLINGDIKLDKKRDTHFVTLSKAGYHQSTISFNREINPLWPVVDLIWGPAFPLAWLIDWQTGAVFRIDPRDIHVVLRRNE